MADKSSPIRVDDLITASADGVLRALDARGAATEKLTSTDLVRHGFFVNIHIICGGRGPLEQLSQGGGAPQITRG